MWRLILLVAILTPAAASGQALRVFVSVLPQETFVEKVGGKHVQVRAMVQPGHSPATYAPTPKQIAALADTDLYLRIGVPFEDAWMDRLRAANPDMPVVDLREGLDLRMAQHHAGHEHGDAAAKDPHVWTSPPLVRAMAARIHEALVGLDVAHRSEYGANYRAFVKELDALHRDLGEVLRVSRGHRFMVFHPAWGYFADTYGLTQVPVEGGGKEPGPKALVALIERAQREKIRVIFVQPQFARSAAERLARAIDGRVEVVDPLSRDYAENLRRVARLIAGASSS